jgi:hypothetical protein
MKRIIKLACFVLPALLLAATVGLSTMGCDDDSGGGQQDMSMPVHHDLSQTGG